MPLQAQCLPSNSNLDEGLVGWAVRRCQALPQQWRLARDHSRSHSVPSLATAEPDTAVPLLLNRTLPFRKHLSFGVRLPEQLRSVVSQQLPIECERSWPPTNSAIPHGLVQQALPGVVVHEFVKASRLQGRSTRTARNRQFGMPKEFRANIPFDPCDRELIVQVGVPGKVID